MVSFISTINLLLAQTAEEKRLTFLYVALFVFLCLLLLIDARERKALVGGNKILAKIIIFMLFASIIVLAILYFKK